MNTTVPTSQLLLATWNIGNGTVADARGIMRRGVAALALQEASDQSDLVDALVDDGFVAIRPDKAGQPATPLVYDPSVLQPDEELAVLTAAKQNIGPGTGPSVMKAKWLIGAHFVHLPSRRRIAIASHHRVAGQNDNPKRHQIAVEDARKVAEEFKGYRGLVVVMGDWNAKAKDDTLAPMRRRRWTSNQLVGGKVPTHGKWAPDHVWWKKADRIAFVGHEAIKGTRSDHRPLLVTLAITHRT